MEKESEVDPTSRAPEIVAQTDQSYDVFLAFAGPDREIGRELYNELCQLGLRVFFDESSIQLFTSITKSIAHALQNSKALLAYYSEHFTNRPACQLELTAAFLASQQRGEIDQRIMVINPEMATGHIFPAEIATEQHIIQPTGPAADIRAVAQAVGERVTAITGGSMDNAVFVPKPRWRGRFAFGSLIGRYPESWELHNAFTESEALAEENYGPAVSLIGPQGIGKTELAMLYAYRFNAAFPGGAYWTTLAGRSDQDGMLRSYFRQCARFFPDGVPMEDHAEALKYVTAQLAQKEKPTLWIIDDIPDHIDSELLGKLLLPDQRVRNLLLGRKAILGCGAPTLELGPLAWHDAQEILMRHRQPDDNDEWAALNRLIELTEGNPDKLILAGRRLQDKQGLLSYAEYVETYSLD